MVILELGLDLLESLLLVEEVRDELLVIRECVLVQFSSNLSFAVLGSQLLDPRVRLVCVIELGRSLFEELGDSTVVLGGVVLELSGSHVDPVVGVVLFWKIVFVEVHGQMATRHFSLTLSVCLRLDALLLEQHSFLRESDLVDIAGSRR